ncbi:MAG: type I DNA topoisomerase, partial [Parasporobacterium sp.]|nr:type I DNA topoisomerase [Parasporobacterium sp.]
GISPILWSKIKRGLSAGRVQSAALRMICERDNEIAAFEPEEYWNLDASMTFKGIKKPIVARFYGTQKKKIDIGSQEELEEILKTVKKGTMAIESIGKSKRAKKAPNAFITSTMQQEAAKALGFTTSKTMTVAQHLYENGFITYLRTDSVRVSDDAINAAAAFIKINYGPEYSSGFRKSSKSGNKVQDAHEAIRPTDINAVPDSMAGKLDKDGLKLYTLIWKRFVASRMTDASYDVTQANFVNSDYLFKASCAVRTFDGFMLIYTPSDEEKEEKNNPLAKLTEDDVITDCEYNAEQHFTQAPPHYTEASLVKAMEEQGIGRPSTYAPTIATLLARRYIKKEKKTILMTELGKVTDDLMTTAFPKIADIKFTANIEKELDTVEEGTTEWKAVIREFYPDFKASLDNAQEKLARIKVKDEESDVICEKCGRRMVYKFGPHGKFLGCPGFPECRNTKPIVVKSGAKCPKCGKELVVRKTKKGRNYYACTGYPECDYMSWNKPGKDGEAKGSKSTVSRGRKTASGASEKTAADS